MMDLSNPTGAKDQGKPLNKDHKANTKHNETSKAQLGKQIWETSREKYNNNTIHECPR